MAYSEPVTISSIARHSNTVHGWLADDTSPDNITLSPISDAHKIPHEGPDEVPRPPEHESYLLSARKRPHNNDEDLPSGKRRIQDWEKAHIDAVVAGARGCVSRAVELLKTYAKEMTDLSDITLGQERVMDVDKLNILFKELQAAVINFGYGLKHLTGELGPNVGPVKWKESEVVVLQDKQRNMQTVQAPGEPQHDSEDGDRPGGYHRDLQARNQSKKDHGDSEDGIQPEQDQSCIEVMIRPVGHHRDSRVEYKRESQVVKVSTTFATRQMTTEVKVKCFMG